MHNTSKQYDEIISNCKELFLTKLKDYGSSWRIMRPSSVTDQIFIKAQRIRSIEENKMQLVGDDIRSEFIGIVNYSIIALIQLQNNDYSDATLSVEDAEKYYTKFAADTKSLMEAKNHDYGEAWRDMRVSSLTDIILMRIFRIKQIEDNGGKTAVSEGIDANYMDMLNYAVFALIKLNEK